MPESADIEPNLSRREEMSISGAAVSGTPWGCCGGYRRGGHERRRGLHHYRV